MRQSQSKDIKSFFGTLVAHGNPRSHSRLDRGTLQSASKLDTGLNAISTTLLLAKDVGEAASQVPYVKAVAGVLSQIIRIRDEIQVNKERCGEIIDLVQRKSTTILQSLDKVYEAKGAEGFEDLKSDLEAYADFLRAVLQEELEPFKTQFRWTSYINRGKNAGDLQKLERELEDFKDRFSMKRLVEISVALLSQTGPSAKIIPQALPPSPKLVIGRDSVVEPIIQVILSFPEPRVAILGPGGIGKTTIGTIVLHDSRIITAYPTRYFVSSELAPTAELLVIRVADALAIPPSDRRTDLVSQIVDTIRRDTYPVFLFIDNLETVWDIEEEQQKVDRFLEVLSGASSKFAILITMRGAQKPKTSFPWDTSVLFGLDSSNSITMYEELSGNPVDVPARELLLKLGGIPLAIKLLASMVEEGDDLAELLKAWLYHGPKALEIGGIHRLSSLEQSVRLSVFSPRIDDTGRLVLGLIALMPDGLSTSTPWLEGFESVLPEATFLQSTLRTLRRAALLEKTGEPSRWQMLPPIRQFCLQLIDPTSSAGVSLVRLYIEMIIEHWNHASSASQSIILPEMGNIRSVLLHGLNLHYLPFWIGEAVAAYAGWATWQNIDESIFLSSFLQLPIPTVEQANISLWLGKVHLRWGRLGVAENFFPHALELFIELQDRLGEANTQKSIGDLHMRREQLDTAEAAFACALELYHELQNRWGEAEVYYAIGDLHMRREQLDTAEAAFACALELYHELQNRWGEAEVYYAIGDLHMRRNQLGASEASFTQALRCYSIIQNRVGEANVNKSMGDLLMYRDQLDAAESLFKCALELYSEIQSRWGEANTHNSIGYLHVRRDQLDAAGTSFASALELYHEIQYREGEANIRLSIGNLHMRRDQLHEAKTSITSAVEKFIEINDKRGIAGCTFLLGKVYFRNKELEAADAKFSQALTYWEDIGDNLCMAQTHQAIGDLHLQRMQLDDAETSLNLALDIFTTKVTYRLDEALTTRSIGKLYLFRGHFEASERAFSRALELDTTASSRVGQGQSHRCLGEMFMKKGDLNAAESSYIDALRLFLEIKDYQMAPCLLDLGKVWAQQEKINKSEALDAEFLKARWDEGVAT
ncbi:hypothetical protein DL96DRAFT_1504687 [Flagelloscypha sp. PMI_526]|nr:hypothetical protein DL96DRAFT_1504687 [Flagelloscypha sp. PMI_526]